MKTRNFFAVLLAVASGASAMSMSADAAATPPCPAPSSIVMPTEDDLNVPTNTKIWHVGTDCPAEAQLQDADGNVVATTVSILEPNTWVMTPNELLEMGATYQLVGCPNGPEFASDTASFTVSAEADTLAPPVPLVSYVEHRSGDYVGDYALMNVETVADLMVLDIAGRSTLDPSGPSGSVVDVAPRGSPNAIIGKAFCGAANWNFDEDGGATDVRYGAFDLAGNFSNWSEPQAIDWSGPQEDFFGLVPIESGCSIGGTPTPSAAWFTLCLGLVAFASVRRRQRH